MTKQAKEPAVRLRAAVKQIKAWMMKHDAPLLVNLAQGLSDTEIDQVEEKMGVKLPAALRELHRLHDGQREELDCFIGSLNFLSLRSAAREREDLLQRFIRAKEGVLGYRPVSFWKQTPLFAEELTERWWPFAAMDSDSLAVNLDTERVFWVGKDAPPLRLAANDVAGFFELYARRLKEGRYTLEEGFGEYYLQSEEPWEVPDPRLPVPEASQEEPEEVVERLAREMLKDNLFFLIEDVEVKKKAVRVELGLHGHSGFHDRLAGHPMIKGPVKAFTSALVAALPGRKVTVCLLPIDVGSSSFQLYLRRAGPDGAALLEEFERTVGGRGR